MTQQPKRIRNKAIFRDDNASLSQGQDKRWYFYFSLDEDQLEQTNYSCLPNPDGALKGSKTASRSVGMDIDFKAPKELSAEEQQAWLKEQMEGVP